MKNITVLDEMYNRVKGQIMSKLLFPGMRIVEDDLAKAAGVSRSAVRSVMRKLQDEGFVNIIPNKGTFVVVPTYEEVEQVYHTRLHLELGVASLAIQNITDDAIARLEQNQEKQKKLNDDFSITEFAILNREFHWEIALASRNQYYIKYLTEIYNYVHVYMIFYNNENHNTHTLYTHGLIIESLKERNEEKLKEAFRMDSAIGMKDFNTTFERSV